MFVTETLRHDVYTVRFITDYKKQVFEHTNKNNNDLKAYATVIEAIPDLEVTEFSASVKYESNETYLQLQWSVKNVGNGETLSIQWVDVVSIQTAFQVLPIELHQKQITLDRHLYSDEMYTTNVSISLPFTIYGDVGVSLRVDSKNTAGERNILNNEKVIEAVQIQLRAPDLNVGSISVSGLVRAGKNITISYLVENIGNFDTSEANWADNLYIAKESLGTSVADVMYIAHENVKQASSYTGDTQMFLPEELSGPMFLFVHVNSRGLLFEGNNENNVKALEIFIEPALFADLYVLSVDSSVDKQEDATILLTVSWYVRNVGNSMVTVKEWSDAIFYRQTGKDLTMLTDVSTKRILESQAVYEMTKRVVLPSYVHGSLEICVHAAFYGELYEGKSKENNLQCSFSPINIETKSPASLSANVSEVAVADGSTNVLPGTAINLEFTVQNNGDFSTSQSSWIDYVYLSNFDAVSFNELHTSAFLVKKSVHIGVLEAHQSYTVHTSINVPDSFSGNARFYVIPQLGDVEVSEGVVSVVSSPKTLSTSVPYVLPNIRISSEVETENMRGGQPVVISYNVTNIGNVSIIKEWYDAVYLSDDLTFDAFDQKLRTSKRSFLPFNPNVTVSVNISFTLPLDLPTKEYILFIKSDSRDDIYEYDEQDNDLTFSFEMETRVTADVAVSTVAASRAVSFGQTISVTWDLINNGTTDVEGYKCDSVYLSKDLTWDINDVQIGKPICSDFKLRSSASETLMMALNDVTPQMKVDTYNALVKSRSNVFDINQENNVGTAEESTTVSYDSLTLGIPKSMMTPSREEYVAFRIENVTEDKSIVIKIQSDLKSASNNIYIKFGNPATLYDFDISSENPLVSDQVLSVPYTLQGDYYLLIESFGGKNQNLEILAKYAELEVTDLSPKFLMRNAQTTLKIKGTLFNFQMEVILEQEGSMHNVYYPQSVYVFSSTLMFATFILVDDIPSESLRLKLLSPKDNTSVYTDLLVKNGTNGFLSSEIESPRRLRTGEIGSVIVRLQNGGDSDLIAPIISVQSTGTGLFQLQDELRDHVFKRDDFVFCSGKDGPAGILRPKEFCQLEFKVKQTVDGLASLSLQISEISQNEEQNPFYSMKSTLQPSHYDNQTWNTIWNNFITLTGLTTKSVAKRMSDVLNEMSLAGRRVKAVEDLLSFLLTFADAPYGDTFLESVIDIESPSDSDVRLSIRRLMPSKIGTRSKVGIVGRGWVLPLW